MENATCHFVFYTGNRAGEAVSFSIARISVGRASNCDFLIEQFFGDAVASHHAEILFDETKGHILFDLGTRSGTYVNGERVEEKCLLQSEDYIRFGADGPEVIFRKGPALPGLQPLPQMYPDFAELRFLEGADAGKVFPINAAETTRIGRRADLEISLDPRGDMIVSGIHCSITYENSAFVLTDTSRNGTFVNDELVDGFTEIMDGDLITLGERGPVAKFSTDPDYRKYPNQRKNATNPTGIPSVVPTEIVPSDENPQDVMEDVESSQEVVDEVAFEQESNTFPSSEEPLESVSADEPAGSEVSETFDEEAADEITDDSEEPVPLADVVPEPTVATEEPIIPAPSLIPNVKPYNAVQSLLKSKAGKITAGVLAGVVLIGLFSCNRDTKEKSAVVATSQPVEDYSNQLEKLNTAENSDGKFTLKYPENWVAHTSGNSTSIQSPDKHIAVDYIRDASLNLEKANQVAARDNANVLSRKTDNRKDNRVITLIEAKIGTVHRFVALEEPPNQIPFLSFLEISEEARKGIEKSELDNLLVGNVTLQPWNKPEPTPAPTPVEKTPVETPIATPPTVEPTETPTPAPEETVATATPSPTVETTSGPAESVPNQKTITSNALKISVSIPEVWSGSSEEADEMIALSTGKMEIRIARDPDKMDFDDTFQSIIQDGWGSPQIEKQSKYAIGEFKKGSEYLMLYLQWENSGSTIVVYITSAEPFSTEMRSDITDVIIQLQKYE